MAVRRLVASGLGLALGAAACAGSGYTYHSNRDEKLYFKLPDEWTVFDTDDIGGEDSGGRAWIRGFVAASDGTVDDVLSLGSGVPCGFVEVLELSPAERDTVSLTTLRGAHLFADAGGNEIDPIQFVRENPDGPLAILGYADVVLDHGARGVRLRVAFQDPSGDAIIDQTVLVDPATTHRYVLNIGCSVECFEANADEIEEVIESWTLEKK